jgi:hypothetical protein
MTVSLPDFENEFLRRCASAFIRRGKALRYQTVSFSVERSIEAEATERMNVDVLAYRRSQIRLSIWPGGALWFRVATPGPSRIGGWDFLMWFDAEIGDLVPEELVALFEESLIAVGVPPASGAGQQLLDIWIRANPKGVHLTGRGI